MRIGLSRSSEPCVRDSFRRVLGPVLLMFWLARGPASQVALGLNVAPTNLVWRRST
jgi:hypothetical protein